MNIIVLNGSPKGKNSVTLQTSLYLEKVFPQHNFNILNVGQQIKKYEKDMSDAIKQLQNSELIIFSYPVYTFVAPYQMHRFIELLKESGIDLSGKYATQISTSKHFYDITAHKYIEQNCYDLGLKYIHGLSADMEDLLKEDGQKQAIDFFKYVEFSISNNLCKSNIHSNTCKTAIDNKAKKIYSKKHIDNADSSIKSKSQKYKAALITNCEKDDENLKNMIDDFIAIFPYEIKVFNIREYPFDGGCLGCFSCASTGKCVYKDNFDSFLRNEIQSMDSMIYAFTIKDHSMGASFKLYDDRQFCNGHRTVSMGMPIGYIISGSYSSEYNLQTIIEGRAQVGHTPLSGIATDEEDTFNSISSFSKNLTYALESKYNPPQNFYGVGGMKIFRDLIYIMKGLMKADHKFYKDKGIYDFPQKQKGTIIKMQIVGSLMAMPSVQEKMKGQMNDAIVGPYKKVIEKAIANK